MGKACPFDQHIQFELHFHLMGLCPSARSRAARHLRTNVDLTISSLLGRTALSVSCSSKTNLTTVTTSSFLHNQKQQETMINWHIQHCWWDSYRFSRAFVHQAMAQHVPQRAAPLLVEAELQKIPWLPRPIRWSYPLWAMTHPTLWPTRRSKSARNFHENYTSRYQNRHCKGKWWQQFCKFFGIFSYFSVPSKYFCAPGQTFHTLVLSSCTLSCFCPCFCPQLAQPLGVQQWPAAIQPCDRHKHVLPWTCKPWSDWLEYAQCHHKLVELMGSLSLTSDSIRRHKWYHAFKSKLHAVYGIVFIPPISQVSVTCILPLPHLKLYLIHFMSCNPSSPPANPLPTHRDKRIQSSDQSPRSPDLAQPVHSHDAKRLPHLNHPSITTLRKDPGPVHIRMWETFDILWWSDCLEWEDMEVLGICTT